MYFHEKFTQIVWNYIFRSLVGKTEKFPNQTKNITIYVNHSVSLLLDYFCQLFSLLGRTDTFFCLKSWKEHFFFTWRYKGKYCVHQRGSSLSHSARTPFILTAPKNQSPIFFPQICLIPKIWVQQKMLTPKIVVPTFIAPPKIWPQHCWPPKLWVATFDYLRLY